MRALARWCLRGVAVMLVLAAGLWGYAEGRQWLLRWRAERLLADVRALEVNRSTAADAQRVMKRFGQGATSGGACDERDCRYLVKLQGVLTEPIYVPEGSHLRRYARRAVELAGLRVSTVYAGVQVRDGKVIGKSFALEVEPPLDWSGGDLAVDVEEGPRLPPIYRKGVLYPVRLFFMTRGDLFGIMTRGEDAAEKARLWRLDFTCVTALRSCREHHALAPGLDEGFKAQEGGVGRPQEAKCGTPYWVTARDEQAVLVGDVASAKRQVTDREGKATELYWLVTLRARKVLKGSLVNPYGKQIPLVILPDYVPGTRGATFPFRSLLVAGSPSETPAAPTILSMGIHDCGVVGATPENLADAERGVQEDFAHYRP